MISVQVTQKDLHRENPIKRPYDIIHTTHRLPVIFTGTLSITKMVEPVPIPDNYLTIVNL